MAEPIAPDDVIRAIDCFTKSVAEIRRQTLQALDTTAADDFTVGVSGILAGAIGAYETLFKSCAVASRDELNQLSSQLTRGDVYVAMDTLMDAETEWDQLVADIELRLPGNHRAAPPPRVSSCIPLDEPLIDVATGAQSRLADISGTRLLVLLRHFA